MVNLNQLLDNDGARKNRIRVGRGIGSGKGKTCGRGEKGQKARTGVAIKGFEGGQMPIFRRLPKRGFNNIFKKQYEILSLQQLSMYLDIKPASVVDKKYLVEVGFISSESKLVKLLGGSEINQKVDVVLNQVSKSAADSIEKSGGKVELV